MYQITQLYFGNNFVKNVWGQYSKNAKHKILMSTCFKNILIKTWYIFKAKYETFATNGVLKNIV